MTNAIFLGVLGLTVIIAVGAWAFDVWSDGVRAGHAAEPCLPSCPAFVEALWILGYAHGANARLLEGAVRPGREEKR